MCCVRRRMNETIAASHRRTERSGKKLASDWCSSQTLDSYDASVSPHESYDFNADSTKVTNQVATNVSAASCKKKALWPSFIRGLAWDIKRHVAFPPERRKPNISPLRNIDFMNANLRDSETGGYYNFVNLDGTGLSTDIEGVDQAWMERTQVLLAAYD